MYWADMSDDGNAVIVKRNYLANCKVGRVHRQSSRVASIHSFIVVLDVLPQHKFPWYLLGFLIRGLARTERGVVALMRDKFRTTA